MNAPVEVFFHEISTPGPNDNVAEILSILGRPLPLQKLSTAKLLPTFPPDFKQRIDAICSTLASIDPEVGGKCERPEGTRPVTDVLDVILTSVLMLRASRQCSHGFTERKSNWVSMLSACGLAMSENVVCCDDIGFARARTRSNADFLNLRDFERKATIAMSVVLPCTPRHFPNKDVPDSTADEDSGSTSDASHDSFATMDLPFDAHISPSRGKRVDCTLPVVFAARSEEMQELMTSLVCQRRVFGISTPVVGISLHEEGAYASLVLGWADDSSPTIVHIAFPPSSPSAPESESLPLGVFDGLNPVSTLRLAQFVLDLEPYFASVKAHALNPQVHDFCWRLDHAHFDHSHIWNLKSDKAASPHNDTSQITAWQATLQLADIPDPDPPFSLEDSDTPEDILVPVPLIAGTPPSPQVLGTVTSMSRTTRSNSRQPSTTNITSPTDSLHPSTAEKSHPASLIEIASDGGESDTGLSDAGSAKSDSASKFAKIFDPDDPRGLGQWTRERETILLFLIPLQLPTTAIEHQINTMITLYEEITSFVWIKNWVNLDDLPPCDDSLTYVRTALYNAWNAYSGAETLIDSTDPTSLAMHTRLSNLCNVVATAATSASNSREGAHVEAGTRGAWDQSFRLFSCDSDIAVSDTYFVEETVQLPINRAVRDKQNFKAEPLAALIQDLVVSQAFSTAKTKSLPPALLPMTLQAVTQAATTVNIASAHIIVGHYVKSAERQNEPIRAKADGVYYFRFDLGTVTQAATKSSSKKGKSVPKSKSSAAPADSSSKQKLAASFRKLLRFGSGSKNTSRVCAETSRRRALIAVEKADQKAQEAKAHKADEQSHHPDGQQSDEHKSDGHADDFYVIDPSRPSQSKPAATTEVKPLNIPHIRCFNCSEVTRPLQRDHPLVVPTIPASRPETELIIPFIYTEYKRDGAGLHQAFNQIKMYCTSGLEVLASMGVTDFPVWGIVCAGNIGVIVMAWKSSKSSTGTGLPQNGQSQYNFIFDRNVKRFNLSDPLQAFHFFTTLHRIHLQKNRLAEKLKEPHVEACMADSNRHHWMMPEPPPKPPVSPPANASKS